MPRLRKPMKLSRQQKLILECLWMGIVEKLGAGLLHFLSGLNLLYSSRRRMYVALLHAVPVNEGCYEPPPTLRRHLPQHPLWTVVGILPQNLARIPRPIGGF